MKHFKFLIVLTILLYACNSTDQNKVDLTNGLQKITVEEALHVKDYTYVQTQLNKWIAVPTTPIEKGAVYYFNGAMEMKNFYSKELDKNFDAVYFVEKLSTTAEGTNKEVAANPHANTTVPHSPQPAATTPVEGKKEINVEHPSDAISIAELFKNKEKYNNKIVKLSGEVTKYNPSIMKLNWFHLQDGTDHEGVYDLTLTTTSEVAVGQSVVLTGKVSLNKDFGAGYVFDVIVEEVKIIK